MIESAFNNPTKVVGQMEYSIMRELNVNEIGQVNGGLIPALVAGYVVRKYGSRIVTGSLGALLGWLSEY
jgi:hypothetical protein